MNPNTGLIYTICGIDNNVANRRYNGDEIPADEAYLDLPVTCVFDAAGNMYFGDQGSMIVRMIDTQGIIHTVAGTPPENVEVSPGIFTYVRHRGYTGDGGPATDALLNFEFGQAANPSGRICLDSQENIYIADTVNNSVRVVDKATGIITTFAGMGPNASQYLPTHEGALATEATLFRPRDVVCDADDNLYIADTGHQCIRMVDGDGRIWTVAGIPGLGGPPGVDRGVPALEARFSAPYGVEIGPDGNLWIADQENNLIRILYF
jgi:streptogramin lyase